MQARSNQTCRGQGNIDEKRMCEDRAGVWLDSASTRNEGRQASFGGAPAWLSCRDTKMAVWKKQRPYWNSLGRDGQDMYTLMRDTYKKQYKTFIELLNLKASETCPSSLFLNCTNFIRGFIYIYLNNLTF